MIFERGTAVNLVERFWSIDPLTGVQSPADPVTVVFTVEDPDGNTTDYTWGVDPGVTHPAVGTFVCLIPGPLPVGIYRVRVTGSGNIQPVANEGMFTVVESGVLDPSSPGVPLLGPCSSWISGIDVQLCNPSLDSSTPQVYDNVAYEASMALYEISGRQFPGSCLRKVRPSRNDCGCWDAASGYAGYWGSGWSSGWGYGLGGGWHDEAGTTRGCTPLSTVKLPGYPVTTIETVLIDGVPVDEFDGGGNRQWRLDHWRDLIRMNTPAAAPGQYAGVNYWPSCQNLALDDTQPGTFSVTYRWGVEPPQLGRDAAAALAGQIQFACSGQQCALPAGAVRIQREGVSVDTEVLGSWFDMTRQTGIVPIDLFLRAYWPARNGRRPAVFSPDVQQYAERVGQ